MMSFVHRNIMVIHQKSSPFASIHHIVFKFGPYSGDLSEIAVSGATP